MAADPLAPIEPLTPQGPVVPLGIPDTQDYPRLVFAAPYHTTVAIAEIIEPSVLEACQSLLPTLVPPYVNAAANAAVNALAVLLTGSTMTGPLYLNGLPTQPTQAADKQYVDTMVATGNVPEVPPVPSGQTWARQTGQWVPLAGGGSVTSVGTGTGLTGGPITSSGTISMANMAAGTLKGNNTGGAAAPTDLNVGQVMTMLGAAPLNSPVFTGTPVLPTGTQAITQSGGTNNTSVATTAFVGAAIAAAPNQTITLSGDATGSGTAAIPTTLATVNANVGTFQGLTVNAKGLVTAAVNQAYLQAATAAATYLALSGGTLTGSLQVNTGGTQRFLVNTGVVIGNPAPDPGQGFLTLNANAAAPPPGQSGNLAIAPADATNGIIVIDSYGASVNPFIITRRSRGTAAAPSAIQSGDSMLSLIAEGYATAGYGAFGTCGAVFQATENWTATAQGSQIVFRTAVAGTAVPVNSLLLAGNGAMFSGSVYLNNANPLHLFSTGAALNVNGAITSTYDTTSGAGAPALSAQERAGGGGVVVLYMQSGNVAIDTQSGTRISIRNSDGVCFNTSGTWAAFSDPSVKTGIAGYSAGLAAVCQLEPISFRYNGENGLPADDESVTRYGLDASAVEGIMPEMVSRHALPHPTKDGESYEELLTIDSGPLIYALVNAVKELASRLEALE